MKVLGRDISIVKVEDATPSKPTKVPKARHVVYGRVSKTTRSLSWNDPEFDFKEISKCLATEAFFRRTVDKYIELIWRNGYKIRSNNDRSAEYIKERLKQIAMATRRNTNIFLRELSQQVVPYSNCFVEKVRNRKASGGRARVTFTGTKLEPIAGYYLVDVTSMKLAKAENGEILGYKQVIRERSGNPPEWMRDDMVHIVKDREAGLSFGTPMVQPVMGDIKALRRMEENIEMLVFNNAMPLYVYLVGDPENPPDDASIAEAQNIIRSMPTEGMIVAPYYHQITAVGAEGRALRCEGYLEYFKNRIFAGLGTSEVAMGYSGSASRSAADTLEKSMFNTVREFQNVIKIFMEREVFDELLLEGGYNVDDEDNLVEFYFPEIDLDDRIKHENHIINLYSGNLVTESEARTELGMDPILPEQREELYFNTIEMIRWLIQSVDEPFTQTVGASAISKILGKNLPGGVRLAKSLDMPSNQHGTKMSPGTTKDEVADDEVVAEDAITPRAEGLLNALNYPYYYSSLLHYYNLARQDALNMIRMRYIDGYDEDGIPVIESLQDYEGGNLDMIMGLTKEQMVGRSGEFIMRAFSMGMREAARQAGVDNITATYTRESEYLYRKNDEWLTRSLGVAKDAAEDVMRKVTSKSEASGAMVSVFDSVAFRIRLGARNELQRAYNIGIVRGGEVLGYELFKITNITYDEDGKCQIHGGKEYPLDGAVDYDAIPPGYMTHPLCTCNIGLVRR